MEEAEESKEKKNKQNRSVEIESTMVANQALAKKKKKKESAIYGNYRNYYTYRIDKESKEDPRFKFLKKEWFEGKDCLDIGCNSGLITVTIAQKFCCRSILGIDIDSARINDARLYLRKIARMSTGKKPPQAENSKYPGQNGGTEPVREEMNQIPEDSSGSLLFDKVSFKEENFIKSWCLPEANRYDTIICFSVTKWVHLNWGDDGLITLFTKIWRLLRPGGILVLEPQPWASYDKKRLVAPELNTNYKKMEIYPKDFQEILLDKIGFRMVDNITSGLSSTNKSSTKNSGFNRPILVLWK